MEDRALLVAGANTVLAGTARIAQTQRATAAGVKGEPPCRRRRSMRNRGTQRTSPLWNRR